MTTLTLDLPAELVARLEEVAGQTGQPLNTLVADALDGAIDERGNAEIGL